MTLEEVLKNKDLIITQKKNAIKHGDICSYLIKSETIKGDVTKENVEVAPINPTVLRAKLVINTTNIIDSHMDCHIQGIWNKSLSEPKTLYLLQEHEMEFDKIIADSVKDDLKAYTKQMLFSELGYSYEGQTEALIFDTQIKNDVNSFMFDLYNKGRVYNHSVGMRYIKIYLCANVNEADYTSEKENWDRFYPMVANKEVADQKGFFWAVTEAKIIEGSAVIKGSNECTPVMEIEIEKEAVLDTSENQINEPSNDTQKEEKKSINLNLY